MNWLITYLTGRYFRVAENIKIQVRVLTKNEDEWPSELSWLEKRGLAYGPVAYGRSRWRTRATRRASVAG